MADKGGAAAKKRKISYEVDLIDCLPKGVASYIGKDLTDDARNFIKEKKIKLKPLKIEMEGAFDEDKDDKEVIVDSYFSYRGFFVMFDKDVKKAMKDNKPDQIAKDYGPLESKCTKNAQKWAEKEGSKSGSTGKKEGEAAIKAIGQVDFSKFPGKTRDEAIAALAPFVKSDKPEGNAAEEAMDGIVKAFNSFEEVWSPAFDAKNAIEDAAKKTKPDKKDKAMVAFGKQTKGLVKEVDKNLEKIRPVLLALFAAQDELKKKTPDPKKLKDLSAQFTKLKSADAAGAQLAKQMAEFVKAFEKVEDSFA